MTWKMKTGTAMVLIAFLALWMGLPFEWLTPQGVLYRSRANRFDELAAEARASEHLAKAERDGTKAEAFQLRAEHFEEQAWTYRKASWRYWKWPELKPSDRPLKVP
jgi:hypothetical protein